MRKILICAAALMPAAGLVAPADAHDPPGVIFELWQWPSSHLPVLDADLSEWDVVPEELWITEQDLNNLWLEGSDSGSGGNSQEADPDPSDLALRFTFGWNDDTERIYLAYDRFDDYWSHQRDDIEITVDADHSGGIYWSLEGQSDEEAQRQRNRHAQISHFFFNGREDDIGVPGWNWHWMTQADWYREPPYSDGAYQWSNPELGQEYTWQIELWHVWWDDFNWADPEGSIIHDFQEGEIIGLAARNKDGDVGLCCGEETGEEFSDWALNFHESSENADFLPDWVLLEVQEDLLPTAVEEDSWGYIKSSFAN